MYDLADALIPPPYALVWQSGPGRVHAGRDGAGRVRVTATPVAGGGCTTCG